MARVVAFVPDLLFGSRVQADLVAAGHEVELLARSETVFERLPGAAALVVDLTDEELHGVELLRLLRADGTLGNVRTLGFYSHVDVNARAQAEGAGFDMIVSRSRMAREGADLMAQLLN